MYMGVCLFQVIICKHLSNVCAALWSLAENALLVSSQYQIRTYTPLCSTVTVYSLGYPCLFSALFVADHLTTDTWGRLLWQSRRDAFVVLSRITGFIMCGLFPTLMQRVCV